MKTADNKRLSRSGLAQKRLFTGPSIVNENPAVKSPRPGPGNHGLSMVGDRLERAGGEPV